MAAVYSPNLLVKARRGAHLGDAWFMTVSVLGHWDNGRGRLVPGQEKCLYSFSAEG